MTITIHKITINDFDVRIGQCIVDVWSAVQISTIERVISANRELSAREKDVTFLIAKSGTDVVGFRFGHRFRSDPLTYYDANGGVVPSFRRQGITHLLLKAQHEIAKEMGYTAIITHVATPLKPMIIANLKFGFDIIGFEHDEKYQVDALVFKKTL
jgi:predicted GNAT superfamily acetyltransferase